MVRGRIGDADLVDAGAHRHRQQQAGRTASSWRRNSAISAVKLALSSGLPQSMPQATGIPVDVDAVEHTQRGTGTTGTSVTGRLPLMYASMHEATKAWRFSGRAALEKPRDQVQPPSEISTFRFRVRALAA